MAKEIILKKLSIRNFKGIKDLSLDFGKVTNIYGENGLGKTSIQDAFMFLLFDKDSKDSSKFIVQPLDKDNNPIHNLETLIEVVLSVDDKELTLKRTYKEKYSKVRGTSRLDFKGYESNYYINDVPQKVTEYKKFVNELVDENIFKLITNPVYFSTMLHWKERREIINKIAGDVDNLSVIDSNKNLELLRSHLTEHSVNDFTKIIKSKIKKLKSDRESLPIRIDEANKQIKEFEFEALDIQRRSVSSVIKDIDIEIQDKSKPHEKLSEFKISLSEKKAKLCEIEYRDKNKISGPVSEIENKIRSLEVDIRHLSNLIYDTEEDIKRKDNKLIELNRERDSLIKEYHAIKDRTFEFDEGETICKSCGRKFEESSINKIKENLESNFNLSKTNDLQKNIKKGKSVKSKIEETEGTMCAAENDLQENNKVIEIKKNKLEKLKKELQSLKLKPASLSDEALKLKSEIEELQENISNFKKEDMIELQYKKQELEERLRDLDHKLSFKKLNEETNERIEKLKDDEAKLSEKIAELEGLEILTEEFIRSKVELLEENINKKFKYVKFKMFRNQVNGGLEECCEPCINGIPFESNLNTAAKINAGLDIINTLCSHCGVSAPIFVDNAESVNNLIDTDSQIIRLVVSKDKKMKVEVE